MSIIFLCLRVPCLVFYLADRLNTTQSICIDREVGSNRELLLTNTCAAIFLQPCSEYMCFHI